MSFSFTKKHDKSVKSLIVQKILFINRHVHFFHVTIATFCYYLSSVHIFHYSTFSLKKSRRYLDKHKNLHVRHNYCVGCLSFEIPFARTKLLLASGHKFRLES